MCRFGIRQTRKIHHEPRKPASGSGPVKISERQFIHSPALQTRRRSETAGRCHDVKVCPYRPLRRATSVN